MPNPLFCYFGSKYRAAPHYPKPLYPHIIEPFAGAAGYSLLLRQPPGHSLRHRSYHLWHLGLPDTRLGGGNPLPTFDF